MTGNVSSPGIGSCWPSAIVRGTSIRTRSPAASDRHAVVARLGLDADDPRVRARAPPSAVAQPDEQPAAAEAHEQHVQRAGVLDQLQRDRALARPSRARRRTGGSGTRPRCSTSSASSASRSLAVAVEPAPSRRRSRGSRRACRAARRRASGSPQALVQPRGERERLGVVAGGDGRDAALRAPRGRATRPRCTRRGT